MTDESIPREPNWELDVERGPDWVFVKIKPPPQDSEQPVSLAGDVWKLMQQHLASRLVVEMDDVPRLTSDLLGELVNLHKRVHTAGGIMRLAGVSDKNQQVLRIARLEDRFPHFSDRGDAVYAGRRPE